MADRTTKPTLPRGIASFRSARAWAGKTPAVAGIFALTCLCAGQALAIEDATLVRCGGEADPAARLACFDAIVSTLTQGRLPDPRAALPAAAPQPAPATAAPPASPTERFGMNGRMRAAEPDLDVIESTIAGRFQGWDSGQSIRLAKGQVWQIVDGSSSAARLTDPTVRVRRGILGAFHLEVDGIRASPKVRRVQ